MRYSITIITILLCALSAPAVGQFIGMGLGAPSRGKSSTMSMNFANLLADIAKQKSDIESENAKTKTSTNNRGVKVASVGRKSKTNYVETKTYSRTEYTETWKFKIRLRAEDERGIPVPNLRLVATYEADQINHGPISLVTNDDGEVTLSDIPPSTMTLRLGDEVTDYSVIGEEIVLGLFVPTLLREQGGAMWDDFKKVFGFGWQAIPETRQLIKTEPSGSAKVEVYKQEAVITAIIPADGYARWLKYCSIDEDLGYRPPPIAGVKVRREVVDFKIAKPQMAKTDSDNTVLSVGGAGQQVAMAQSENAWNLRVRRDALQSSGFFVLQLETDQASFASTVPYFAPDPYSMNVLSTPYWTLESVKRVSLVPAVGTGRISPFNVRSGDTIAVLTGRVPPGKQPILAKRIGIESILSEIRGGLQLSDPLEPYSPENRQLTVYGEWYRLPEFGVELRFRSDKDHAKSEQQDQGGNIKPPFVLPSKKHSIGILEAVRVTGPQGGSIGDVLRVGSTKTAIRQNWGEPDTRLREMHRRLGMSDPVSLAAGLYGRIDGASQGHVDYGIGAWDETYLEGGIRIKYDESDRVKWFEVCRPIELLENGMLISQPNRRQRVYVLEPSVLQSYEKYTDQFRASIDRLFLRSASTSAQDGLIGVVERVVDPRDADFKIHLILSRVSTSSESRRHSYRSITSIGIREVQETFDCPDNATVSVTIDAIVMFSDGTNRSISWTVSKSETRNHVKGRKCKAIDHDVLLQSLFEDNEILYARLSDLFHDELSVIVGSVMAVNYRSGSVYLNVGKKHGVQVGKDSRGRNVNTHFAVYSLIEVDPRIGAQPEVMSQLVLLGRDPSTGSLKQVLEVQEVGDDWCIAAPKTFVRTGKAMDMHWQIDWMNGLSRIFDPSSGLLRAKIIRRMTEEELK